MCGTAVTLYSGLLFHSTFDLADYTPKYMMDTVFFPLLYCVFIHVCGGDTTHASQAFLHVGA